MRSHKSLLLAAAGTFLVACFGLAKTVVLTVDIDNNEFEADAVPAIRETVTVEVTNAVGYTAGSLVFSVLLDGTLYAQCSSFSAEGNGYTGSLDLNTVALTNFFADFADQAKRQFTVTLWDSSANALLFNDKLQIQNNPYYTGMPDATTVTNWAFTAYSWCTNAGGDVSGHITNVTVVGIQGDSVSTNAPSNGQALIWDAGNSEYSPGDVASSLAAVLSNGVDAASQPATNFSYIEAATITGATVVVTGDLTVDGTGYLTATNSTHLGGTAAADYSTDAELVAATGACFQVAGDTLTGDLNMGSNVLYYPGVISFVDPDAPPPSYWPTITPAYNDDGDCTFAGGMTLTLSAQNMSIVLNENDDTITFARGAVSDVFNATGWEAGGTLTLLDDKWVGLGSSAGRIEFDDQATDEVNILNANVGIGTNAPAAKLHVNGAARIEGTLSLPVSTGKLDFGDPSDTYIYASAVNQIRIVAEGQLHSFGYHGYTVGYAQIDGVGPDSTDPMFAERGKEKTGITPEYSGNHIWWICGGTNSMTLDGDDNRLTMSPNNKRHRTQITSFSKIDASNIHVVNGFSLTCSGLAAGTAETGDTAGKVSVDDAADVLIFGIRVPSTFVDSGAAGDLQLDFYITEQAAEECNIDVRVFEPANTTPIVTDTLTVTNGASAGWFTFDSASTGIGDDSDIDADDSYLIIELTANADADDFDLSFVRLTYAVGLETTQ
jgi:hypothetical protein